MRRRWIYQNGEAIEVGQDYVPEPRSPLVMGDIKPYQSVVTGEEIGGRRQHREHLKAHGLIEVGNEKVKPSAIPDVPGRREALIEAAKKHGLLNR